MGRCEILYDNNEIINKFKTYVNMNDGVEIVELLDIQDKKLRKKLFKNKHIRSIVRDYEDFINEYLDNLQEKEYSIIYHTFKKLNVFSKCFCKININKTDIEMTSEIVNLLDNDSNKNVIEVKNGMLWHLTDNEETVIMRAKNNVSDIRFNLIQEKLDRNENVKTDIFRCFTHAGKVTLDLYRNSLYEAHREV